MKHCVFCGKKPEGKSKEHVVPRWLIELTGDPKRKAFFGFTKDLQGREFEKRIYAFDQFTFPACSTCNHKYSSLEAKAKKHINNILNNNNLTASEFSELLDWFDKVRVGSWLGMRLLDKNYADVEPKFHIDTRIGQYDRMLIVEKSDTLQTRLCISGIETWCFALSPVAFLLIINGYYLTNVSSMFLCSRRLGFPYIKSARLHPDREEVEADLAEGRERIMLPILRRNIAEKGRRFFQPMFKNGLLEGETNVYDSDYVESHSLDSQAGTGNIFEESTSGITEYGKDDKIALEPMNIQSDNELHILSAINILEWQLWISKDIPDMSLLRSEQKKYIRHRFGSANRVNRMFIEHYKKML